MQQGSHEDRVVARKRQQQLHEDKAPLHWEHQKDWGTHAPKPSQKVEGQGEFREEKASIIWAISVEQRRAASLCEVGNTLLQELVLNLHVVVQ